MFHDILEYIGITGFAQIALLLFLAVFLSVLIREWLRPAREVQHMAGLPLADDALAPREDGGSQ